MSGERILYEKLHARNDFSQPALRKVIYREFLEALEIAAPSFYFESGIKGAATCGSCSLPWIIRSPQDLDLSIFAVKDADNTRIKKNLSNVAKDYAESQGGWIYTVDENSPGLSKSWRERMKKIGTYRIYIAIPFSIERLKTLGSSDPPSRDAGALLAASLTLEPEFTEMLQEFLKRGLCIESPKKSEPPSHQLFPEGTLFSVGLIDIGIERILPPLDPVDITGKVVPLNGSSPHYGRLLKHPLQEAAQSFYSLCESPAKRPEKYIRHALDFYMRTSTHEWREIKPVELPTNLHHIIDNNIGFHRVPIDANFYMVSQLLRPAFRPDTKRFYDIVKNRKSTQMLYHYIQNHGRHIIPEGEILDHRAWQMASNIRDHLLKTGLNIHARLLQHMIFSDIDEGLDFTGAEDYMRRTISTFSMNRVKEFVEYQISLQEKVGRS